MRSQIILTNNPDYIQSRLWPLVIDFVDIVKTPGMSAHSIMSFMIYATANNTLSLYAVLEDSEPKGFICLQELGPPYYSTCHGAMIYLDHVSEETRSKAYKTISNFCKERKLKYFSFETKLKKLADHLFKHIPELKKTHMSYVYGCVREKGQGEPVSSTDVKQSPGAVV